MKIYKLKPEKVETLRAWGARLMTDLHEEALTTLREENCTHEFFALFKIGEDFFVAAHMEGDEIVPAQAARKINQQHKAVLRECVAEEIALQEIYNLKI